jgi:hypothetical protein
MGLEKVMGWQISRFFSENFNEAQRHQSVSQFYGIKTELLKRRVFSHHINKRKK